MDQIWTFSLYDGREMEIRVFLIEFEVVNGMRGMSTYEFIFVLIRFFMVLFYILYKRLFEA